MTAENRRPIAARRAGWASRAAAGLASRGVRPNLISQASMGFALIGAAALALTLHTPLWADVILFLIGALGCQGRLICNLLDGMVAVEGGLSEADGPFWNEAPDRVSDALLFAGAGVAAGLPWLGLLVAVLAIFGAYLREMGRAEGMAPDFSGPLAKPQRMAALTVGAVLAALSGWGPWVMQWTLIALALGTAATVILRSRRLLIWLRDRGD